MDISTILLLVYVFFVAVSFRGIQDDTTMLRLAKYLRPIAGLIGCRALHVIATLCFAAVRPVWFVCKVIAAMMWPGPGSRERYRP